MTRDFTYISDVIEILFRLINKPAKSNKSFDKNEPNPASSWCPHQIFNIGNGSSIKLLDFINALEEEIGMFKLFEDMQLGDVKNTSQIQRQLKLGLALNLIQILKMV